MNSKILLNSFNRDVGLVRYQIDSYNDLIENRLQKVLSEIKEIKPEVPEIGDLTIKLGKVSVGEPQIKEAEGSIRKILPLEARLRGVSYMAPIYVELKPTVNNVEQEAVSVVVGEIPVMVKSKICPLSKMGREELEAAGEDPHDNGGYFIINGTEKFLVLLEEIAPNRMLVENENVGNYMQQLRINSEYGGYGQRHLIERKNDGTIYISFANVRRLPIVVLIKALGMESDRDMIEEFGDEQISNEFLPNIYEVDVETPRSAIEFIATHLKFIQKEQQKNRIEQIIDRYLLPHLGQDPKIRKEKARYLIRAAKRIIEFSLGKVQEDDLDHYANKRVKIAGDLLELLFRSILIGKWGLIARVKYNYQKMAKRGKIPPIQTIVESNVVTNQMISAMATGSWVGGRTGISQRLERKNAVDTLSDLRLVLSPLASTQEHFEARELHPTHWGRFDPAETPEGPTIGLRKHLALFSEVTKGLIGDDKKKFVQSLKFEKEGNVDVFVDGVLAGKVADGKKFVDELKEKRRKGAASNEINTIYYSNLREVRINTDAGRVRRPLAVINGGKFGLTDDIMRKMEKGETRWQDLVKQGIIEYIDAEEEDGTFISLYDRDITTAHTHLELTPIAILGTSSAVIPFPDHNRGDRINLGSKMIGQSIGIYQNNFPLRTDTKSNVLIYPQVPLVTTDVVEMAGMYHNPMGQNVVIALLPFKGYGMEDAVIFNKASIERGLFRSMFYRIYDAEEKRYWGGEEDKFGIPDKNVKGYKTEESYSRLTEDGSLPIEAQINGGDVIVGRVSPLRFLSANELISGVENLRDSSILMRTREHGTVDRVFFTETLNGTKLIKASIRDMRAPELGDKFASRHGQKGVIGLVVPEIDMPFSASGVKPDVIIDPHGVPSRQTLGQILEFIGGKAGALNGKYINGSAFESLTEKEMGDMLESMGFQRAGKEVMYNGITGEKFEVEILVGVCYYSALEHMVANKLQVRSRGPVTLLTRQPTEGKAKEGGLRLGEMEKDCLIAHGAVLTLKERFDSDKVVISICRGCGIISNWDKAKEKWVCTVCKESDIVNVEMSYAFKLLLDELKAMMIYPRLNVSGE